jgi:hypothetical protein
MKKDRILEAYENPSHPNILVVSTRDFYDGFYLAIETIRSILNTLKPKAMFSKHNLILKIEQLLQSEIELTKKELKNER